MVSAYMDLLAVNEGYIQAVQNALSRYIDFSVADERSEILRTELLRRIQKDPQRTIFPDLLIWMYIQQKDMTAAFVQSKAMDKRFDEGGVRLMELARIALANKDHGNGLQVLRVRAEPWAATMRTTCRPRIGAVRTRYEQLTAQAGTRIGRICRTWTNGCRTRSTELGLNKPTMELLRDRAHLKAYYLNDHAWC